MAGAQSTEGPMTDGKKPLARVTVFLRKKKGLSDEEFSKHWVEVHGPLFTSLPMVKERILRYTQLHFSPQWKAQLSSMGAANRWPQYDGLADIWAKDVESILGIFSDPDISEVLKKDTMEFCEGEPKMAIGYDHVQWDQAN